jgi:hypothetical protein
MAPTSSAGRVAGHPQKRWPPVPSCPDRNADKGASPLHSVRGTRLLELDPEHLQKPRGRHAHRAAESQDLQLAVTRRRMGRVPGHPTDVRCLLDRQRQR